MCCPDVTIVLLSSAAKMSVVADDTYRACLSSDLSTALPLWRSNQCVNAISQVISQGDASGQVQPTLNYNPDRMQQAREDTTTLLQSFDNAYGLGDDSSDVSDRNLLLSYCRNPLVPGVCDTFLNDYCDQFSRQDLVTGQEVNRSWCGCYVPPDPSILPYANQLVSPLPSCPNDPNPGAACDPLCRASTAVKKSCLESGQLYTCPQNVCVINNVSIDVSNSEAGTVNINTLCSGCDEGCLCIVDVDSNDPNLDINQVCGSQSICIQTINEETQVVTCQSSSNIITRNINLTNDRTTVRYSTVVIVVIVLLILVGILLIVLSALR